MIQKPLCPTLLAPKEMLQGGFGDFYFYKITTAADGFGFDDNERMRQNYDKKIPPRDPGNLLRAPSPHQYPMEMRRYPFDTRIWRGIHWRCTGIHWIPESGVGGRFPPIQSLLLPPNHKGTLKPEAFSSSCLHPHSKLCVKDTRGYTRAVGLWNHVLIMIQKPLFPTSLTPKEMLPPFLYFQGSVCVKGSLLEIK
jgi:hypothetical protein